MKNFRINLECKEFVWNKKQDEIIKSQKLPVYQGRITVDEQGNFNGYLETTNSNNKIVKSYIIGVCDLELKKMIFIQFYNEELKYPFPVIYVFNRSYLNGCWQSYNYLYGGNMAFLAPDDVLDGSAKLYLSLLNNFELSNEDNEVIKKIILKNSKLIEKFCVLPR